MTKVAESYACVHCGARSYNPNDVRETYCGACHRFAADPVLIAELVVRELGRLDELARVRRCIGILERRVVELADTPRRLFSDD